MIKIGFWFDAPFEYTGGLNYIRNLLHALAQVDDGSFRPYVFFAADLPTAIEQQFLPYATVVRTRLIQRGTVPWFFHRVLERTLGIMPMFRWMLKSHGIDVLSHLQFPCKGTMPCRIISWVPDFQYLHLPHLFPRLDADKETRTLRALVAQSDRVILSSEDAFQDFKRIAPAEHWARARVLPFVSQPRARAADEPTLEAIGRKYGFSGRYFHLPNQFWAHKNHMVVLQAVDRLKRSGTDVQVLCTGNPRDDRLGGTQYIDDLRTFIEANGLQSNIRLLGLIDYTEMLVLMRNSVAVLNPSRFEGWSSSVEEAKSMGRPVVLSNIGTHVEQQPAHGHYFHPDDADALAAILERVWSASDELSRTELEANAAAALQARTLDFGRGYQRILREVTADLAPQPKGHA
ncbi:glycosyltransferase family 4 protein [Ramlibacter sp.]|uniref:glycosyltransferase family 4 protein n=1 Tax=Ramlibacter sp. TaxID=1917967 RepID=UPI003D0E7A14